MQIKWSGKALSDLTRLHDFLSTNNKRAAGQVVQMLVAAPTRLLEYPRLGERLDEFVPREVRRLIVGNYEMRYEVADVTITILRLWHAREDR